MKKKCSIITIVYNGVSEIEQTIKSVINQTFTDYEYIIIDGASTDGTLNIVNKYQSSIHKIVSEKDDGIYNAMNKGLSIADGQWVIFMNCGDCFYDMDILKNIFDSDIESFDLVIGGAVAKSSWNEISLPARKVDVVWKSFTHQSVLAKKCDYVNFKFNEKYRCASDFDFVYRYIISDAKILSFDRFLSLVTYIDSGHSAKYSLISKFEVIKSVVSNFSISKGSLKHLIYHSYKFFLNIVSKIIGLISPKFLNFLRLMRDKD